jgi:hypothetical protein
VTDKQLTTLLSPVRKLSNLASSIDEKVTMMYEMSVENLKKSETQVSELKQQTSILKDIKDLLKEQKEAQGKNSSAPKVKLPGLMSGIGAGLAIVTMAAALVAAAGIFSVMPNVNPNQLLTAIAIGATFVILTPIFIEISESLRGGGMFERVIGKISGVGGAGISGIKDVMKNVGGTGLAMISMAIAVTAASAIFTLIQQPSIAQIGTALLVGLAMIPVSFAFAKFYTAMQKRGIGLNKNGLKTIGFTATAMALSALAIVGVAYAFRLLPSALNAPDPAWVLKTGLALFVFSMPFVMVMKAIKGQSLKNIAFGALALPVLAGAIVGIAFLTSKFGNIAYENAPPVEWSLTVGLAILAFGIGFVKITNALKRTSFKDIVKGTVAVGLVALAIVGVNFIFQYLVDSWSAPPVDWTLKSGLAILAFGISFALLTKALSNVSIKGIAIGLLGTVAVAVGILAVGWIFTLLDGVSFVAPPMDWALKAAIAITVFAIPVSVIGLIAKNVVGAAGILLGVVGMIVIAAGMLAVAWIFNYMPDLGDIGANITAGLLAPVNGIVDILKRFKEEIGIENLLPLAGGIVAISGSLLVLAGATAGVAAAGLGAAVANVGKAFLDWVSGEKTDGPMDVLLKLANNSKKIMSLATPLKEVASSFVTFSKYASTSQVEAINGLIKSAIMPITPEDATSLGISNMSDYMKVYASSATKVAKAYGQIAKHSKGMNVEAIKASTQMFNALAYLASVGKDDALAKLGDSLITAVKELALMISDFEGTVKEAGEQNTQVESSIGGFVDGIKDAANNLLGGGSQQQQPTNVNVDVDVDEIIDAIETLKAVLTTKGIRIQA